MPVGGDKEMGDHLTGSFLLPQLETESEKIHKARQEVPVPPSGELHNVRVLPQLQFSRVEVADESGQSILPEILDKDLPCCGLHHRVKMLARKTSDLAQRMFLWTRNTFVLHRMVKSAVESSSRMVFPMVEKKVSWLLGSGMILVLNIIFRKRTKCMIRTLPGPAVTLSLAVESHHNIQLENIAVILSPLSVLLVAQKLMISLDLASLIPLHLPAPLHT